MSVVSHGNNWAGESTYVDAEVLSPKYMATTAKIPIQAAILSQLQHQAVHCMGKWNAVTIASHN